MTLRDPAERPEGDALRGSDVVVLSALAFVSLSAMAALARVPLWIGLSALAGFWIATLAFLRISRAVRASSVTAQPAVNPLIEGTNFAATLTDALPQAIAVLDRDGHVIHANALARDLIEMDDLGRPLSVYVRDTGITDRLSKALAGYAPDPLMVHRDVPTERYISLLFSPLTSVGDGSGRSIVLVVLNDVTELVLGSQRRADFLANASHELKTPLASMLGYIETLRGHAKDDPEAQARFLGIMAQQAERMQRLINDLLSLRRIEQQEHIAPTETADLDLSIRAAIESVAPLAEARGVKLKYSRKKRSIVPGHQDETIQLCLNLIENATKISAPGDKVFITLRRFDQWTPNIPFADSRLTDGALTRTINPAPTSPLPVYSITISDSGPGFAREHMPRIGERFYRIAGDLSSKEKGTGLGLAIVKHIARRHRAGLFVRSAPGRGSEFCIIYQESDDSPHSDDGAKTS
ncbi:MAG: histidine kinase dimerization/phospho-acceptor domain-containing protein [Litorimonas sp.]